MRESLGNHSLNLEGNDIRITEVCRYLGYKKTEPDEATLARIHECVEEMPEVITPRHIYRRWPLRILGSSTNVDSDIHTYIPKADSDIHTHILKDDSDRNAYTWESGGLTFHSKSLTANLAGCEEVFFFAATLGSETDRCMRRLVKLDIAKAAVMQAVFAAALEAYCDKCEESLKKEVNAEGLFLRPRFSPGYGDFSLSVQKDFLDALQATKRIGIYLSEGDIMIPEKSVTAIMGIAKEKRNCHEEKCEACANRDCAYRRETLA